MPQSRITMDDTLFTEAARREEHFFNIQDHTMGLYALERRCSYPDFELSSRYCMDMLRKSGFEQVERIAHRADGKTASCDLVMPQAWTLDRRSFLAVTAPCVAEYDRILADSDSNPVAAVIWSAPTPPQGIDAEIVDYDALDAEKPDVRGKFVLFTSESMRGPFGKVFHQMADLGAAGLAMSCFAAERDEPDELYWFNGLGRFGWYLTAEDPKLPIFSLSPRRARFLKGLLQHGPVSIHAEMHTRLYDGEIYTVTGVIPGESEEEYALLAHMYEPFPGDDALGVALGTEIGCVLREAGVRPRKTLRAVFSSELYGFTAYLNENERFRKIAAALSLDGFTHRCSPEINLRRTPIASPFFGDFVYRDNLRRHLPNAPVHESFGTFSDDTFGSDPAFGIPTNWLYNPSGVSHHNTGVGFLPDWRLTAERFPMLADTVLKLICCSEFPDYAPEALRQYEEDVRQIMENGDLTAGDKAFRIQAKCDYHVARLKSMARFAPTVLDEEPFLALMRKALTELPTPEEPSELDAALSRIVPTRFAPACPSSLAKVPQNEKRHFSTVGLRPLFALFDGKRSLLDAIRLIETDSGRKSTAELRRGTLDCLRYLEKYGYVSLT